MSKKFLKFNYKNSFAFPYASQAGQTIIETLVAIFILVMGIVAALGLAIYSLNASSNVSKQIVAIGLAREGVEAVKNMRDTNWLKLPLANDCYDYASAANSAYCYKDWLDHGGNWNNNNNDRGYRIDPGSSALGTTYVLSPDLSASNKQWVLTQENNNFGLDLDTNVSGNSFSGLYVPNLGGPNGNSDFYRQITLIKDKTPPFDQSNFERLKIQSQVWWVDKKCPRVTTWSSAKTSCRLELDTYLTNWKNY